MVDTGERGGAWRIGDGVMGGRSKVVWAALLMTHRLLDVVIPAMDHVGQQVSLASFHEMGVLSHASHEVVVTFLSVGKPEIHTSFPMVEQCNQN
jgi:hypothetical protein